MSLTFNPLEAKYFQLFHVDPEQFNRDKDEYYRFRSQFDNKSPSPMAQVYQSHHGHRQHDFRMTEEELSLFQKQGFVISTHLSVDSFAEAYYRIYTDDLPVFVSADSILHAFHRSFDHLLMEVEHQHHIPWVSDLVRGCVDAIPKLKCPDWMDFALSQVCLFLSVANQLCSETPCQQLSLRHPWFMTCIEEKEIAMVMIGERQRQIDFSQFEVRGHYTKTKALTRYFNVMTWFRCMTFMIDGPDACLTQWLMCILLANLVKLGNQYDTLVRWETDVARLVGKSDCMTISDVIKYLEEHPIDLNTISSVTELSDMVAHVIQTHPRSRILSDVVQADNETSIVPFTVGFLGNCFAWDTFAMNQCLTRNIPDSTTSSKPNRRMTSGLDVAAAVFNNPEAQKLNLDRMKRNHTHERFVLYRDGVDYGDVLQTTTTTIQEALDHLSSPHEMVSIYDRWLLALRTLSLPVKGPFPPQITTGEAWMKKNLNTQLGSWTQLRHDTCLLTKQSYESQTLCEYPAGAVEPNPDFFRAMHALVDTMSEFETMKHDSKWIKSWKYVLSNLETIANKQIHREDLTKEEVRFLKNVMEEDDMSGGSRYLGWYPSLFAKDITDSGEADFLVTDVHSDVPDFNLEHPGNVLHEGVGFIHMMFVVFDHGDQPCMYAGPVFGHHEFISEWQTRLDDCTWERIARTNPPPISEWMTDIMMPYTPKYSVKRSQPNESGAQNKHKNI